MSVRVRGQRHVAHAARIIEEHGGHFINHFGWFETGRRLARWKGRSQTCRAGFLRSWSSSSAENMAPLVAIEEGLQSGRFEAKLPVAPVLPCAAEPPEADPSGENHHEREAPSTPEAFVPSERAAAPCRSLAVERWPSRAAVRSRRADGHPGHIARDGRQSIPIVL
jgi:hypothetical protein